jgi:hypothetical protein
LLISFRKGSQRQGSLVLGGYDRSRFTNDKEVNFSFNPVTYRDLVVGISSIFAEDSAGGEPAELLPDPIHSFVDAATSHIWLPEAACTAFQRYFGLQYNETLELYLVNSTQHQRLISQNASITFQLFPPSDSESGGNQSRTVEIVLPYSAFDLELSTLYPNVANETKYFPLRRAENETQYTLGRTFLQEAYMVVDYERGNFSISQVRSDNVQQEIVAIDPPNNQTKGAGRPKGSALGKRVPLPVVIGVAIGAFVLLLIGGLVLWWIVRRHRRKRKEEQEAQKPSAETNTGFQKAELDGEMRAEIGEGPDPPGRDELDGEMIVEAAGELDKPELGEGLKHELDGDQFRAELGDGLLAEMDGEKAEKAELEGTGAAELDSMAIAELYGSPVPELDSKEVAKGHGVEKE